MISGTALTTRSATAWREQMEAHAARAARHTLPARKRKDCGIPHPVEDFLFQYYPYSFALLENWHPSAGTLLEVPENEESPALPGHFSDRYYSRSADGIFLNPRLAGDKERQRLVWIQSLLVATQGRAPNFACHGLHEWAMVYRGKEVRHAETTPLRLPQAEVDALVESRTICCSHYDAFRFFTDESRPLNRLQPTLDTRVALEQPGCVHANMDLYKWAAKAMPWVGSDLLVDCFELAIELRDLDMRASPYDLRAWDREPICIETAEGRRIYETEQKRLAGKAAPLRKRLIEILALTISR